MTQTLKFTKVDRGWYATEDGTVAVVADGYEPRQHIGAEVGTGYEGYIGGEWAVVTDQQGRLREDSGCGENQDWFPTKREAVAAAPRFVR